MPPKTKIKPSVMVNENDFPPIGDYMYIGQQCHVIGWNRMSLFEIIQILDNGKVVIKNKNSKSEYTVDKRKLVNTRFGEMKIENRKKTITVLASIDFCHISQPNMNNPNFTYGVFAEEIVKQYGNSHEDIKEILRLFSTMKDERVFDKNYYHLRVKDFREDSQDGDMEDLWIRGHRIKQKTEPERLKRVAEKYGVEYNG